jgi:hypothetical protein
MDSGSTGEGVYCAGANSTLTLNTNSTVSFPRVLSERGNGLSYSSTSGQPIFDAGSFQLVFDHQATIASNKSMETLDAVLQRLISRVESLGYAR